MKPAQRQALIRRVLFAAWGMATFVLLFCVALLTFVLVQRSHNVQTPAAPGTAPAALTPVMEPMEPTRSTETALFFAAQDGRRLAAQPGAVEFTDYTAENCRHALEALVQGPKGDLGPILPPETKIRGVYLLEDGLLVVDFAMELELGLRRARSLALESLMLQGIAHTVTQPQLKAPNGPAVTRVSILIEGSPPRESFPAHADLSVPVTPDPNWLVEAGG